MAANADMLKVSESLRMKKNQQLTYSVRRHEAVDAGHDVVGVPDLLEGAHPAVGVPAHHRAAASRSPSSSSSCPLGVDRGAGDGGGQGTGWEEEEEEGRGQHQPQQTRKSCTHFCFLDGMSFHCYYSINPLFPPSLTRQEEKEEGGGGGGG